MPIPTPVHSNEALPDRVDTVVIGGGIAGVCTAWELARRGQSIALFEKGIVAGEQSSKNWGWCRQMGRDPRELPLIQISMQLWKSMRQMTGEENGFRECGIAYLCESEDALAQRQKWHDTYVGAYGLSSKMITGHQAAELAPGSSGDWKGGIYTPNDGRAEPILAVPAMARAAQRDGVQIFQQCAVRGIDRQAGKIIGAVTEKGTIKCDNIVLAGGAWSRRFCHNMDISLPQLTVVNSVARTDPLDAGIDTSLAGDKFAIRKRLDGGYTLANAIYNTADIVPDSLRLLPDFVPLMKTDWRDFKIRVGNRFLNEAKLKRRWAMDEKSPFEEVRQLDAKPSKRIQDEARISINRILPIFQKAEITESWAGVIDTMPDVVPVISEVPALQGFFMATGFSGHGFGLGPGAGKLMAEIIIGEPTCVDPKPFNFNRF